MSNFELKHSSLSITLLLLAFLGLNNPVVSQVDHKYAVIGYYMGSGEEAARFPIEKLTHIIYSFLHLDGNELSDKTQDSLNITELVKLKQRNPKLKVILSLGGWGGCPTCPDVFATDKGRTDFAVSVKRLLEKYQADGLDLDWEYPAIASIPGFKFGPEDRSNFTELIIELRETLGNNYEISFAAGGFKEFLDHSVEWQRVINYLDYINLMTYDMVNGYSTSTGHHTSLYSTSRQAVSTDYVINYLDSLGIPTNKLIIGAAFYARIFKNVGSDNNGLYQSGIFSDYVNFRGMDHYFEKNKGFIHFWDNESNSPYAYNPEAKLFATFDNERSIGLKSAYLKARKLGGIMFWSLGGDKYEHGLLDIIDDELSKPELIEPVLNQH